MLCKTTGPESEPNEKPSPSTPNEVRQPEKESPQEVQQPDHPNGNE